jgi:PKD repeat protein
MAFAFYSMKYFLILWSILIPTLLNSQKNDYNWFAGEYDPPPGILNNFVINFNNYPVEIKQLSTNYYLNLTHHSVSDQDGKLLYYSGGCNIWQYGVPPTLIADNLNNDDYLCGNPQYEVMNLQHGLFSLPLNNNRFMIFGYTVMPQTNCYLKRFIYHIIDFSSGVGQIEVQDSVIANGCFNGSAANRHANGRDWWILLSDKNEHRFYRWLLTPEGLSQPDTQVIFQVPLPGKSHSWYEFSPDGQRLATRYQDTGTVVYDFDRCTGLLSNCQVLPKPSEISAYIVFSPNNRYIYTCAKNLTNLIQYDLLASDVENSEQIISIYDGFIDTSTLNYTTFDAMGRGPDGKIYIFGGSSFYMHIIDFPDRSGVLSHLRQRAITFPSYTFGANAYYPNYRLGPIDGSSCDSLGIDNIPMAMYHYDIEDTLVPLSITFTDASYYEPTNWYWTFGDGSSSTEVSPVHTYLGPGTYTACLVVSNQYGADTLCRDILVDDISGVSNLPALPQVRVGPNPFNDVLQVQLPAIVSGVQPQFRLLDLFGREVFRTTLRDFDNVLSVKELPAGMYVWQVAWQGKVTQAGKIVGMK